MGKDRYPGVNPFSSEQQEIFFGRAKEKEELLKYIQIERIVVLHSKSGLGKSSLLRAAVIPEIENHNEYAVVPVRFFAHQPGMNETPIEKLSQEFDRRANSHGAFLDHLVEETPSLWYHLKRLQAKEKEKMGILLVFDQFEELFTYPREEVAAFGAQLASAVLDNIPQPVLNKFEQVFQQDPKVLTEEEIELLHRPFKVKLLFVIRSDYLNLLSEFSPYFPKILNRLFRLQSLSVASSQEAIVLPAYLKDPAFDTPPFGYSEEALESMIDYLTNKGQSDVESYQLQILCHHIEKNILSVKGDPRIEARDLGDLDMVYENYYANQILKLGDEASRTAARRLIEEGLIQEEDERRLSLHGFQIRQFYGINQTLLDKLVSTRLIRPEPHFKGGYIYELSHDSIVKPILKAKQKRLAEEREQGEAENLRLQQLEAERLREENRREKTRVKNLRLLLLFVFLFIIMAGYAAFLVKTLNENKIKNDLIEANAKSNVITNFALLESDIDRVLALNLAKSAMIVNEDGDTNKTALKVFHNLLVNAEIYPFYQKVIGEHPAYITDLDVSPDGKRIVSGCMDGKIRIWSIEGALIKAMESDSTITDVDWLDDGRILSGNASGKMQVWKADGSLDFECDYRAIINDVELSPNGKKFTAAGRGGSVQWWDERGSQNYTIRNLHEEEITNISFVDNDLLITASYDRSLKLVNLSNSETKVLVSRLPAGILNIDFFFDSSLLAAGLTNGLIKIWRFDKTNARLNEIITIPAHISRVSDLAFTDNGTKLLSCSWDRTAKLWTIDGVLLKTFIGHKDGVRAATIVGQGDTTVLVTGGEDRSMKVWRQPPLSERIFDGFSDGISSVAFSGDGEKVFVGSYDGTAKLFSLDGKVLRSVEHKTDIYNVAISKDGETLAVVGKGRSVSLWRKDSISLHRFPVSERDIHINSISFAPGDKKLIVGCSDHKARVFDLNGNVLETFSGHSRSVRDAVFSFDGKYVLTAGDDNTARLWTSDGKLIKTVTAHTDRVNCVAFSHDSQKFLTGSWDNRFYLWHVNEPDSIAFFGHYSDINKVAFSKDDQIVLSASSDNTVRLWRANGQELPSIIQHSLPVTSAAFSPDGQYILTGSRDGTARLWRVDGYKKVLKTIPPPTEEQKKRYGLK